MSSTRLGTYRVKFADGTILLTGNNYKSWYEHMTDYFYRVYRQKNGNNTDVIESVEYSPTEYVDDGGLKWCDEPSYEEVIAEESRRLKVDLTPYTEINFSPVPSNTQLLRKKFSKL